MVSYAYRITNKSSVYSSKMRSKFSARELSSLYRKFQKEGSGSYYHRGNSIWSKQNYKLDAQRTAKTKYKGQRSPTKKGHMGDGKGGFPLTKTSRKRYNKRGKKYYI